MTLPSRPLPLGEAASYRPEVDGLRAIAVALVILFHAKVPGFGAGFLGVDIFFAISGFLITGIIARSAEQGRFSLRHFYMRRIRRIIPALVVMCLLTLPFAWLTMMPDDFQNFGQSLVSTAASANNVLLYLTSGYWGQQTQFKPLFHTWSLGVEEQYYVVVPLLLMLAIRCGGRRGAFALLGLGTAASLIHCEAIRHDDPQMNFMMLPSRFWELGLGGLASMAQPGLLAWLGERPRLRQGLVAAGLAMVLASGALITNTMDLPGWQALLPLLGICLVLVFANQGGAGRVLSFKPVVGLGLISYSVYLYHLPLFVLLRVVSLDEPSPFQLIATLPLCLVLAWLSWRYVEQPMRNPARTSDRFVLLACGSGLAAMAVIGLVLHVTEGLFEQSSLARRDPQTGYEKTAFYNGGPFRYEGRQLPAGQKARNVLVLGNSYARDFINMGLESGALNDFNISYEMTQHCEAIPPRALAQIENVAAVVLASGVAGVQLDCVKRDIARFEALQVPHIIVLGTKQFGYNNNAVMLLPEASRYSYRARPQSDWLAEARLAQRALSPKYYLDLFVMLDDGTGTVPVFAPGGKLISQDTMHLTTAGARYMGERVFAQPQFAWLKKSGN